MKDCDSNKKYHKNRLINIKILLVIGVLCVCLASLFDLVVPFEFNIMSFVFSIIGHLVFIIGLVLIDRKAKSILSAYYIFIVCISVAFYLLNRYQLHNVFINIILILWFFYTLFKYLQIFTRISGQTLFIKSFYVLVISIVIGSLILAITQNKNMYLVYFVLCAMICPSFFMYVVAILTFQNILPEKINKVNY